MKVKEESEEVGLKLNIQKTKIMASGPITSWQMDVGTVREFILGGSKITADGDSSHEIKRHLLLGRKATTKLDSILKSRDITLPTRVCLIKAELQCWRRLFRVLWTARRSNQSILRKSVLNIHWKDWCWRWNSNILATWCEELTHLLGKIEGRRRRGWQRMRWLDGITDNGHEFE